MHCVCEGNDELGHVLVKHCKSLEFVICHGVFSKIWARNVRDFVHVQGHAIAVAAASPLWMLYKSWCKIRS